MTRAFTAEAIAQAVDGLCAYVDASPSPFHAVENAARLLRQAGFVELSETDAWALGSERSSEQACFTVREGSLVAWSTAFAQGPHTPFRVVGAHTDSPNLRIKPEADSFADVWNDRKKKRTFHGRTRGWDQLNVDVYGGPLLNSWLDRDLGLSGRVAVRSLEAPGGVEMRLFHVKEPLLRIPQLAIHLDRDIYEKGLQLNPQKHLTPIWGVTAQAPTFHEFLAEQVGCGADEVLGWDAMTHDTLPSARLGHAGDLLAAPRLDNLCTSYCGTQAFIAACQNLANEAPATPHIPVLVLFDHEEIGSTTNRGAGSQLLPAVLERITVRQGGARDDYLRAMAGSIVASGDMSHAAHPNYKERHEEDHRVALNCGPVLKVNSKGRYATDASGTADFTLACQQAEVPLQTFVSRGDMPCGSTVGPITSALSGAVTVDFGAPMLSMHSARELCGTVDIPMYIEALQAFLAPRYTN